MIPTISLKSGREIPKIALGTYMIGGGMKRDQNNDDAGQIKMLKYAIDSGISHIRTAQNYASGHCEELIGQAISGYDRNKLFITVAVNENFGIDEQSLVNELTGSLKRLKTEYIDLFLIGGINPGVSLKKIAKGLSNVKELGLTKDIGTSNYRMNEFEYLNTLLDGQIIYNELQYNLIIREPDLDGMKEYLNEKGIVLGAYRALQQGQLSKPGYIILDKLAEKYRKTPSQIALKWLLKDPRVVPIVKSSSKTHIDEIATIFDWEMEKSDTDQLSIDFPIQIKKGDCMPPTNYFTK